MGTFTTFNTATSGIEAAKTALDIISNNIANANTPGYKRQAPILMEGNPPTGMSVSPQSVVNNSGSGVQVVGIQRMQDTFLDAQVYSGLQSQAQWNSTNDSLQSVQTSFGEDGTTGVSSLLTDFWNKWQDLAANPSGLAARQAVVSSAGQLSTRIQAVYSSLQGLQGHLDTAVQSDITQVNTIASQIAALDQKIVPLQAEGGYGPNDLIDQRDQLLQNLSKLVSVQTHGAGGSDFVVTVDGTTLVQGNQTRTIQATLDANNHIVPTWEGGLGQVSMTGGDMKGLMDVRDTYIPSYLGSLDNIASTLVTQVNSVHAAGYGMNGQTGTDFFTPGTTAANISVNAALVSDPSLVAAASAPNEPSNADTAQAIGNLANASVMSGQTISQSYNSLVSQLGSDVSVATNMAQTQNATVLQLQQQQQSISGVSLDQEMTDMMRYQQSYGASARMLQTVNDLLTSLMQTV